MRDVIVCLLLAGSGEISDRDGGRALLPGVDPVIQSEI
jgi:hypothetical protein